MPPPLLLFVLYACDHTLWNKSAYKLVFFSSRDLEYLGLRKIIIYLAFWQHVAVILMIYSGMEQTFPTKHVKATSHYAFHLLFGALLLGTCAGTISIVAVKYNKPTLLLYLLKAFKFMTILSRSNVSPDIWIARVLLVIGSFRYQQGNKEIRNREWFLIDALCYRSLQGPRLIWYLSSELYYILIARDTLSIGMPGTASLAV